MLTTTTHSSSITPLLPLSPSSYRTFLHQTLASFHHQQKNLLICSSCYNLTGRSSYMDEEWKRHSRYDRGELRRRCILFFLVQTGWLASSSAFGNTNSKRLYDEKRLLEQNKRMQKANNAPEDFPNFVRQGFQVKVVTSGDYVKCDSGLIYLDIRVGSGDCPKDGQQVTFHYVGYNESGRRIDSSYLQGSPAKIRMGTNALVPGFEAGIRDMKPGGKRRIIIPPELGPPVGPSTFFSSKQFEVFDVELLSVQNCQRRTIAFYSDVVCN